MAYGIHRRGRGRAPSAPGVVGSAQQLAFISTIPVGVANATNWGITIQVQLQDDQGNSVALAGVEITLGLAAGSSSGTFTATEANPGPNGGQYTDSGGVAAFTSPVFTGTTGVIRLQASAAMGSYASATSSPITVVAGSAAAAQSTASIPNPWDEDVQSEILIQTRDVSGNALTTGGSAVVVTISGANGVGPASAVDLANGTYRFTYTPANPGTESIAITLNAVPINGSPFSRTITDLAPPVLATKLYTGMFGWPSSQFGQGPGDTTALPRWSATVLVMDPSTISSIIDLADTHDILVFANFANSRQNWSSAVGSCPNIYDQVRYQNQVQRFSAANIGTTLHNKIRDALLRRRLIAYIVDEPFHPNFCNSISKAQVNDMGLLHKSVFGNANCITAIRDFAANLSPAPAGGWTGLDYGWAQYEASIHVPSNGQTVLQFLNAQYAAFQTLNMGVIAGHNFLDGGNASCWDYLNTGGSSGRVGGTFTQGGVITPGQFVACETGTQGNTRWFTPPAQNRAVIDALVAFANYASIPALLFWVHSPRGSASQDPIFGPLEDRVDTVAAMDYVLDIAHARTSFAGWRTPK